MKKTLFEILPFSFSPIHRGLGTAASAPFVFECSPSQLSILISLRKFKILVPEIRGQQWLKIHFLLLMEFLFVAVVIPSVKFFFFNTSCGNRAVTSNKFFSPFSRGVDCAVYMKTQFQSVSLSGSIQNSEIWPLCIGTSQ